MLLSKRRLRWATIALLLACGAVLIQPTRAWLQRVWLTAALGPHISVGEVVYHGQSSIVEVRGLSWQASDATGAVGRDSSASPAQMFSVQVPRCWLGLDRKRLADGRIYLPKVVLQDAVLTLSRGFPESNTCVEDWREGLARYLEKFEWKSLERRVNCLTAVNDSEAAWNLRTADWVNRSRGISKAAERIEAEAAAMDNPLRFEASMSERLTHYSELAAAQRLLCTQLEDIDSELLRDSERLQSVHDQDLRELRQVCSQLQAATSREDSEVDLAPRLAMVIAQAGWQQVAPYGQIATNISQAAATFRATDYDVTVRADAHDHIQCMDLMASGEFRYDQFTAPFRSNGSWRLAQQSPGNVFREFNFVSRFDCRNHQMEITGNHDSRELAGIQMRIRMLDQDVAKRSKANDGEEQITVNSLAPVTAKLTAEAGKLSGTLRVAAEIVPLLSRLQPRDYLAVLQDSLEDPEDGSDREPLEFELTGTWQHPQLKLNGAPPTWLQQAVERLVKQQSQERVAQAQDKLEAEFKLRIEHMRERIGLAAREAQRVVARDESRLLSSQQNLQLRFDEMTGTEFARRTGELQR